MFHQAFITGEDLTLHLGTATQIYFIFISFYFINYEIKDLLGLTLTVCIVLHLQSDYISLFADHQASVPQ